MTAPAIALSLRTGAERVIGAMTNILTHGSDISSLPGLIAVMRTTRVPPWRGTGDSTRRHPARPGGKLPLPASRICRGSSILCGKS